MKPDSKVDSPVRRKDSIGTTWKKAWRQLVSAATLTLVPKGAGFAVSVVGTPVGGELADIATRRVVRYGLHRWARIYEDGEFKLKEVLGREIPERRYSGVGDFWAKIIRDKDKFVEPKTPIVQVTGLLSPYGPLMPAHPMSRPGYSVEGWQAMGDLETEDTEEYDTRDDFIYGDRVIRLSSQRNGKYYGGLYDPYFGISNVAIPLYVDAAAFGRKNKELGELWKYRMTGGKIVTITGRLIETASYYAQFIREIPEQFRRLPSFRLEVFKIENVREPDGFTHMAVSVCWLKRGDERLLTHYFNVQDKQQFETAESLLDGGRESHSRTLLFNYDDLSCFSPKWRYRIPEYNEMLKPWLEGERL